MEVLPKSDILHDLSAYVVDKEMLKQGNLPENSIFLLDKPYLWSSFKLVKRIKYYTQAKRVGHAGTLDPLATGLMIICTGKCTKMIEQIQDMDKVYTGLFNLGKTTPSYDLETEFDQTYPTEHITDNLISDVVSKFQGDVEQIPPNFSAIKINGTRAYKKARNGDDFVIKSRFIKIYDFKVNGQVPNLNFEVNCSKGTYIRTLAHDFGKNLESGCYLSELKRTRIGIFDIENAFQIDEIKDYLGKE
ncbi:MAG: tRNA pseudouridine(55) synthase TruB [Bacteroidota bacterium]|nr:tRNA pseudouridine(55) synthase TruB [Bacteroidota bacterium]